MELVRILKDSGEELGDVSKQKRGQGKIKLEEREEFRWYWKKEIAFQAIKQAIANNVISSSDPTPQYYLEVDASKQTVIGLLFELELIPVDMEAISSVTFHVAVRIIIFISF